MPACLRLSVCWKDNNGNGRDDRGTCERLAAREFAYESLFGPRARYRTIDWDANGSTDPDDWTRIGPIWWTDYDGVLPYTDAEATEDGQGGLEFREVMAYLGTVGSQPLDPNGQAMDTRFHHADLIGSVWLTTSSAGEPAGRVSYTAFGEVLDGESEPGGLPPADFPRYEYAGLWGYESGGFGEDPFGLGTDRSLLALGGVNPRLAPIRLLHVGWRWYQPDIGRFVQRDPLGVFGTVNVYLYVEASPSALVDPTGEGFWDGNNWFHDWVARHFWMKIHSQKTLAGMSDARVVAESVGLSVAGGVVSRTPVSRLVRWCVPGRILWFIRIESHPIGGLKGALRGKRLLHINVGRKHIILDPRYWWY